MEYRKRENIYKFYNIINFIVVLSIMISSFFIEKKYTITIMLIYLILIFCFEFFIKSKEKKSAIKLLNENEKKYYNFVCLSHRKIHFLKKNGKKYLRNIPFYLFNKKSNAPEHYPDVLLKVHQKALKYIENKVNISTGEAGNINKNTYYFWNDNKYESKNNYLISEWFVKNEINPFVENVKEFKEEFKEKRNFLLEGLKYLYEKEILFLALIIFVSLVLNINIGLLFLISTILIILMVIFYVKIEKEKKINLYKFLSKKTINKFFKNKTMIDKYYLSDIDIELFFTHRGVEIFPLKLSLSYNQDNEEEFIGKTIKTIEVFLTANNLEEKYNFSSEGDLIHSNFNQMVKFRISENDLFNMAKVYNFFNKNEIDILNLNEEDKMLLEINNIKY